MNVQPIQSLSSTASRDSSTLDRSQKDDGASDKRQSFEAALAHADQPSPRSTPVTHAARSGALDKESEPSGDTEKAPSKGLRQHRAKSGASCDASEDEEIDDDSDDAPANMTAQAIPAALHFDAKAATLPLEASGGAAPVGNAATSAHDAPVMQKSGDDSGEASVPKALLDRLDAVSPHQALSPDIRALVERATMSKTDPGISNTFTTQSKVSTSDVRQSVAASTPQAALDPSARGAALALGDLARRIGADIHWQASGSSATSERAVGIRSPEAPHFEARRTIDSSAAAPSPFDLAFSKRAISSDSDPAALMGDSAKPSISSPREISPARGVSADDAALRIVNLEGGLNANGASDPKPTAQLHANDKVISPVRTQELAGAASARASTPQAPSKTEVLKQSSADASSVADSRSPSADSATAGTERAPTTQASSAANGRQEDTGHQRIDEASTDKVATPDARVVASKLDGSHAVKDASKDKDGSSTKIDSLGGAARVIDGAVRTVEGLRSSTKVSDAHVARVIDERSAERQSNVEVAVSRMTLKNGMRAETEVADLGRVSIEAKNHANSLDLKVIADRPDTAQLIERNRSELRADLDRSHAKLADLSISSGSSGAGSSYGQGSDRRGQGSQRRDRDADVVSDMSANDGAESAARGGKRVRIVL